MTRGRTRRPRGTRRVQGTRATIDDTGGRAKGTRGPGRSKATTDNTGGITRGRGRRRATRNVTEERDNRTTRTNGNPAQNPTIEEVDMTQDAPAHNMSQSNIIP